MRIFNYLLFLSIILPISLFAQENNSSSIRDIPYYDSGIRNNDLYINERCKLDIFKPANAKDLPTLIWFHGGAVKAGSKEIPKEFTGGKYIIVGVKNRLSPKVK